MNKVILSILLALTFSGCSLFTHKPVVSGKASKAELKASNKIELVNQQLNANTDDKLKMVSQLSYGTDYSLNVKSNSVVASSFNKRIQNIVGLPPLESAKQIQSLVDELVSTNSAIIKQGLVTLELKDKEIATLQNDTIQLISDKQFAEDNFKKLASRTAQEEDTLTQELKSYTGLWGVDAIIKGSVSLVKHLAWLIGITGLLYFVLRAFAASNPVVGAIFGVFTELGSIAIKFIEWLVPQSLSKLEVVAQSDYQALQTELDTLKNQVIQAAVTKPIIPTTASVS